MGKLIDNLAGAIVLRLENGMSTERKRELRRIYSELYVGENVEEIAYRESLSRVKRTLLIAFVGLALLLALFITGLFSAGKLVGDKIYRPAGSEKLDISLVWTETDGEKGSLELSIKGVAPEFATLEDLLDYGEAYIRELLPDSGIAGDLKIPAVIPGTSLTVKWTPENYYYLLPDGSRTDREIRAEGERLMLSFELSAFGAGREFEQEVLLLPLKAYERSFAERLAEYVRATEEKSFGAWLELPLEFEGKRLSWEEKKNTKLPLLLLLLIILIVGSFAVDYEKNKQKLEKREKEMLNDYPELVSKLLLLLQAGLTIRGAWDRIVKDYRNSGQKRYVYEEMCISQREMENGISEVTACEGFGQRCRLLPYLRFAGLLTQNLTKGARSVLPLLEQEAVNAFEERKEAAKRLGEEASTKLLLPMVGILTIIIVMIMYPAFQNI